MELVSVLMSTYKEPAEWVKSAVDSILNQTYPDIEFIIVQDCPENAEVRSLLMKIAKEDERIILIKNPENYGIVKSLNIGLTYCRGAYIARMDADDISLPDRIRLQVQYLKETKYDLIGSDFELFSECQSIRVSRKAHRAETCREILKYESCSQHPSWLGRSEVFRSLYGYREFDTCEDLDFMHRAVLSGYKIGNCPWVCLRYRVNPDGISNQKAAYQKATSYYLRKQYKKKAIISLEDYNRYLESADFRRDIEREKTGIEKERILKDKTQPVNRKLAALAILIFNRPYMRKRLSLAAVRYLKRSERLTESDMVV